MISIKGIENTTRKVWLAGLGSLVYGKEFATSKIDQAYTETTELLTNLMSVGEKIRVSDEGKLADVDQRIMQIRGKLGLDNTQPTQLEELEQRVAHLTDVVTKLAEQKAAEEASVVEAAKPRAQASSVSADKPAEAEAKPKTRTRTRKVATKATASEAAQAPAKTTRRRTTRKAATKSTTND